MRSLFSSIAIFLSLATYQFAAAEPAKESRIGQTITNFELADFRGQPWSLAAAKDKSLIVVAFMGIECPLMQQYAPRLQQLQEQFASKGVELIAINSNQQDTLSELGHFAKQNELKFPLLKDPANKVADLFQAERTPEVFVLDKERKIRYHGRIDDQYGVGVSRVKPQRLDLALAIEELLANKPVSVPETEPTGCFIGKILRPKGDVTVTYSKHIAPIFNEHCVRCHRPGEIGPFALTNYEESVGWAEMIAEVVEQQRMPPWHANPKHGQFANDARLSDEQKQLIYRWVDEGAAEGDRKDLPPAPKFATGWQIGEPDQVIYMSDKPAEIPAHGEVKYRYFFVDPKFTEDKWIQAAECRPGNPAVVHHIIVATRDGTGRGNEDLDSGWLAATAPGAKPMILPPGLAKKVPAGSKFIFQMHYTPNGKATTDRSSIGLKFCDPATVKKIVATEKASYHFFAIPPGAESHKVDASTTFRQDTLIYAFFPHMHVRGKAFRYTAVFPDGKKDILLDVPRYDFNWQNTYELAEPLRMPAGSKMVCEAWYDNSANNPSNPDPKKTVRWGDQTWEEMMIGYFSASLADQDLTKPVTRRTDDFLKKTAGKSLEVPAALRDAAAKALTSDEALQKFGVALRETVPQLDRVCWTVVEERRLVVKRCAQEAILESKVGGTGRGLPQALSKLARHIDGKTTEVHNELKNESGADLVHMTKAYQASVHIPVTINDVPGTLNFWSAEKNAFPSETVKWLEEIAAAMAK
jgi:peroxiredoxin